MSAEIQGRMQAPPDAFRFGQNWQRYLSDHVDPERERIAAESVASLLETDLSGKTFLDIGCGSGLFSLAALRAGAAEVISVDVDPDSVAATQSLRDAAGGPDHWRVIQGSILDDEVVAALPEADVVYSWGVLHHTGDMDRAVRNAAGLVAGGGIFCIAIYNRVTERFLSSQRWRRIKRRYNHSSRPVQVAMEALYTAYWYFAEAVRRKRLPRAAARAYRERRGMAVKTDLVDWLGGYPYEYATAEEMARFCESECGLERRKIIDLGPRDLGCNELVFDKPAG
jgi:2-polyprenyl-6-hydroxyphenyl methylase/3-demethylubiquinone-9 3-methyltransferase